MTSTGNLQLELAHNGRFVDEALELGNSSPSEDKAQKIDDHPHPASQDSSRASWINLAAVSVIAAVTWGFGDSQGVFREYYFKTPPLAGEQLVALTGLLASGLLQTLSPFLLKIISTFPFIRFYMMWAGMIMIVASSISAAISTSATAVIMTQGLMYGISGALLFAPCLTFVDELTLGRRGLTNGIFFGAPNIAASILSPTFSFLLQQFGPRVTLVGWGGFAGIAISSAILCIRPQRIIKAEAAVETTEKRSSSRRALKRPVFWLFILSMTFQSLCNNLPANYLPSYATDLGVTPAKGALLVTFLSLSGIIGQISIGALADKIGPLVPMLLSTLVSSFAVLVVWGLAKEYWSMILAAVLFGSCAFSFMVLRSFMAAVVVNDPSRPDEELFVSGILLLTRGVVGISSGYIAAAVLQESDNLGIQSGYGAGKWRLLLILMGSTMAAATIGAVGLLKKRK